MKAFLQFVIGGLMILLISPLAVLLALLIRIKPFESACLHVWHWVI